MADKPKVAFCWFTSCGGCDETVVDLNYDILKVADAVDIVLWPVAMDFKYSDIEKMADKEITLSIINGSVRNSEQEEIAHLLRQKSQLVLAFGACACFGGTPGLANLITRDEIFKYVYQDAPTAVNPEGVYPKTVVKVDGKELTLPEIYDQVRALNQVIEVDYYLPGCPPPPNLVLAALIAVLEGKLPSRGATLAPEKALCDTCPRNKTKPEGFTIKEFKRVHQVEADPDKCFLLQGIVCLGPATRSGCNEACMNINMPCRGCFGPMEGVPDMGAKYLSAIASLIDAGSEEEMKKVIDGLDDPAGYFYRFSVPSSILGQRRERS